jgi:hypothetical protein
MNTPSGIMPLLPVIICSLAALGGIAGSFFFYWRKRLIDDLPTSKTQGVFLGLTELKGTAESEAPLTCYLSGKQCVLYNWKVEERWSRWVTETYTDAQGHIRTRTRRETGWKTVAQGGESVPFYLKDDTGVIRVLPEKASISDIKVFDVSCGRDEPLYFAKGPEYEVPDSDHIRRFHESAIPLHAMLYVMGTARERQDVVAAEIAYDKSSPMFIISVKTEKQVSRGFAAGFWSLLALALVLVLGGIAGTLAIYQAGINWQPLVIGAAAFLFVIFISWLWTVYNSLVSLRQRVLQAWSQVDVQLKRRNDLIPNLVHVIEGYQQHEREVQQEITELRGQLAATPPGMPGADYSGLSSRLLVLAERYPELKASELFLHLQRSLTDTEQRIALARDYFNDVATFYNTRLEIIPDRLVAAILRLKPRQLMGAADFERAAIKINLVS